MNSIEAREAKLSKILKHFLRNERYVFTDAISNIDDIGEGYYIQLVSEQIDYNTYLSNEYLDNNPLDVLIRVIERRLAKLRNE